MRERFIKTSLSKKIAFRVIGAFALISTSGCNYGPKSNEYRDCYDLTGMYDPTPNYPEPHQLNGDEFSYTTRVCFEKDFDINEITCPQIAKKIENYIYGGVKRTNSTLLKNTCQIIKV